MSRRPGGSGGRGWSTRRTARFRTSCGRRGFSSPDRADTTTEKPHAASRTEPPMDILEQADPEVFAAVRSERRRQQDGLELIASENYTSPAVMAAQGSCLTNKYAEGYPGRRYYGGCEFVDDVERLAIDRAKQLFGAAHVNVQPHSGSQANMSVYLTACQHGDTILGMDLSHGGHLTHGHPLNFSGK